MLNTYGVILDRMGRVEIVLGAFRKLAGHNAPVGVLKKGVFVTLDAYDFEILRPGIDVEILTLENTAKTTRPLTNKI